MPNQERIAKNLSRRGVASRREVERMIQAGRISLNGEILTSAAVLVGDKDLILLDGKPVAKADATRVWRYHKPKGVLTTRQDEKNRKTVFDTLPKGLPRVHTIGRLDMNSEGLLLLTNDGKLKRKLELPSTGWIRKYRVRVHGKLTDEMLNPLRAGLKLDEHPFLPMQITIDRQQGSNAWLSVALREGKNREIRRAFEALDRPVNRLIRISYGPFQLGDLKSGEVVELRQKALRDQLGLRNLREKTS